MYWLRSSITLSFLVIMNACVPVVDNSVDAGLYEKSLLLVDQGVQLMRLNDLKSAQSSFKVALELAPIAAAVDGLGCIAFLQGDLDQAESKFLEAYNMDSTYDEALGNLAMVYEAQGKLVEARKMYTKAIKANPDNYRFRNNYSIFLAQYGGTRKHVDDELRKAGALQEDPIIKQNMKRLGILTEG